MLYVDKNLTICLHLYLEAMMSGELLLGNRLLTCIPCASSSLTNSKLFLKTAKSKA